MRKPTSATISVSAIPDIQCSQLKLFTFIRFTYRREGSREGQGTFCRFSSGYVEREEGGQEVERTSGKVNALLIPPHMKVSLIYHLEAPRHDQVHFPRLSLSALLIDRRAHTKLKLLRTDFFEKLVIVGRTWLDA
jgi:hypothetical protein